LWYAEIRFVLAPMHLRIDGRNAPSMRHYISHNFIGAGSNLSPPATQESEKGYQGSKTFRNFAATHGFTPATARFADRKSGIISGSRARFIAQRDRRFPRISSGRNEFSRFPGARAPPVSSL
jgi:hypothetical protein